jgi:predicted DCC family thiol-disulfide oxidoreductase YuxK
MKRAALGFWNFWTQPIRAERAAAFRISIAAIVCLDTLFTLLPYATDWFGASGLYPPESYKTYTDQFWRWSLIEPEWSDDTIVLALWALIGCSALTAMGLFTRVASIGMWVLLMSFQLRNPIILNGGDLLLRAASFYVMIMPGGAAWSLDNLIRRKLLKPVQPGWSRKLASMVFTHPCMWGEAWRGESSRGWMRPWSLRLTQIQLVVLYFFTGVDKLNGVDVSNRVWGDWVGGSAVYRILNHGTISRFAVFGDLPWWLFAPMTWITLGWEIAFGLLVLWRPTRWYALAFGYVLHVGIFLTAEVTHFSWTTLAFYWLFIPAAVVMDMAGKATGSTEPRKYTVFYDGMCPICKKSRRTLEKLDWLGRLNYADIHDRKFADAELPTVTYADMLKQMYVKRPDGKFFGGFKAFRAIAAVLPLMWPIVPLLWLPGAAFIGTRLYRVIARNRFRWAKCDDEFCSLHLKLLAGHKLDEETIRKVVELHERHRAAVMAEPVSPV